MNWVELSDTECASLLTRASVGRLGLADDSGRLTILPVNYHWDGSSVMIRTGAGSKLAAAAQQRSVAFEIDSGSGSGSGGAWSVLIRGSADLVGDDQGFQALETVDVSGWIGKDRPVIIRVDPKEMTGRQLAVEP